MDHLPHDVNILYSAVNMLLRDGEFDTLDELCYAFGEDPRDVRARLDAAGYEYYPAGHCLRSKLPDASPGDPA